MTNNYENAMVEKKNFMLPDTLYTRMMKCSI